MKQYNLSNIGSFIDYLKVSIICTLVFAIPCLIILLGFNLMGLLFAFLFLVVSLFVNCPIVSGFAWLIRDTNRVNKWMGLKLIGAMPGMFFGFLFGAFIASSISNQLAIIASAIFFFSLGMILGMMLGTKIGKRILIKE